MWYSKGKPIKITLTLYSEDHAILDWLNAQQKPKARAIRNALAAFVSVQPGSPTSAQAETGEQLQALAGQVRALAEKVEALGRQVESRHLDEARQIGRVAADLRQEIKALSGRLRQDVLEHVMREQQQAQPEQPTGLAKWFQR